MLKAGTFNGNDLSCFKPLTAGTGKIHQTIRYAYYNGYIYIISTVNF
jgi:hypothetical protein